MLSGAPGSVVRGQSVTRRREERRSKKRKDDRNEKLVDECLPHSSPSVRQTPHATVGVADSPRKSSQHHSGYNPVVTNGPYLGQRARRAPTT